MQLLALGVPLVAIASAWGGIKVALNGTVKRVDKIEGIQTEVLQRCTRMETKIDLLLDRK